MIILIDAGKVFHKTQNSLIIKNFSKQGPEVNSLNMIKGIFEKATTTIIFNSEKSVYFTPK